MLNQRLLEGNNISIRNNALFKAKCFMLLMILLFLCDFISSIIFATYIVFPDKIFKKK